MAHHQMGQPPRLGCLGMCTGQCAVIFFFLGGGRIEGQDWPEAQVSMRPSCCHRHCAIFGGLAPRCSTQATSASTADGAVWASSMSHPLLQAAASVLPWSASPAAQTYTHLCMFGHTHASTRIERAGGTWGTGMAHITMASRGRCNYGTVSFFTPFFSPDLPDSTAIICSLRSLCAL